MSTNSNAFLNLYIGTEDSLWEDFLYLDLVVPGREINLWKSEESLGDAGGEDFLKIVEEAFNEARIYMKVLPVQAKIEYESILEICEELDESCSRNIRQILKELKGE